MEDDGTLEYENSLIDLSEDDQWLNPAVTNAVNALQEALYTAGCNLNPMTIVVSTIPGDVATVLGDYGKVEIKGTDDEV